MSINSWIDGKVLEILQAFGVELPSGDGETLRSIARSWDTMGTELPNTVRAVDSAISGVDKQGWHGRARDAFEKHWGEQKKVIEKVANNFHQVARGLRSYADEIDNINEEIIDICVEIAEMEIAGAVLSAFTGFLSDIVANTAVAERVAKIIDLVKLFTSAAEKVAGLLERFGSLSAESAATLERVLATVARLGAKFATQGAESFATNFVADSGSMMLNQALNGAPITVGQDFSTAGKEALGTAAFTAGGASLAEGANITGRTGSILSGEGRLGTTVNGALGNISGGLTADVWNQQDGATIGEDALTNAATGALETPPDTPTSTTWKAAAASGERTSATAASSPTRHTRIPSVPVSTRRSTPREGASNPTFKTSPRTPTKPGKGRSSQCLLSPIP